MLSVIEDSLLSARLDEPITVPVIAVKTVVTP